MAYDEEEDESIWLDKPVQVPGHLKHPVTPGDAELPEEEEAPDPDFDEDEKEDLEEEETSSPPKKPPVTPIPTGSRTPAPPSSGVATAAPVPIGECCKRMKREVAEQTNVMFWEDHKKNKIIVFAHNLNMILHCPFCGAKL